MFWIKILASIMIFIPSTIIGIMLSRKYSNRVENITSLINCILILDTEIIHLSNPVNLAFKNVYERSKSKVSIIFLKTIETLNNNRDSNLYSAFKNTLEVERLKYNFTKQDKEILLSLAKVIGVTDREEQKKYFDTTIEQLKIQRKQAIEEANKNEKLYKKLGIIFALLIILILI
ncbi:stage III sporulation protein AB [Senegalia massiliensis]|uniref:Stage III sporulation protein AB n=1 Tax=Senegalia massiliensis TaxID=1720316 RepID=A0A845QXD7_9CLOT|nr:stage III sporulation protein AB [Senegalia massiliensis]NBI06654.1 stage III sporulation protein AB [Senegalia massiliensis]